MRQVTKEGALGTACGVMWGGVEWGGVGCGKMQRQGAACQRLAAAACGNGCELPGVLLNPTSLIARCCMTAPIPSGPINNDRAALNRAVLYAAEKQKGEAAGQSSTTLWGIVASGCEPWRGVTAGHLAPSCVGDAAFVVGRAGVKGWLRGSIFSGAASTSCPAPKLFLP